MPETSPAPGGLTASAQAMPERARVVCLRLLCIRAIVSLTDGYRLRLRHAGHSRNLVAGHMHVFGTQNFSDTYSPEVWRLCTQSALEANADALQLGVAASAAEEAPTMPTRQRMHEVGAH